MAFKDYQTNWVGELPEIGLQCPQCQKGVLECNDFVSKAGEKYFSVKCATCFTKWIVGHKKFPPKTAPTPQIPQGNPRDIIMIEKLEEIIQKLEAIRKGQEVIDAKIK